MPRKNYRYNIARVLIDDVVKTPVRCEAYDWPEKPHSPLLPVGEYTHMRMKLANGFIDFDLKNSASQFTPTAAAAAVSTTVQ